MIGTEDSDKASTARGKMLNSTMTPPLIARVSHLHRASSRHAADPGIPVKPKPLISQAPRRWKDWPDPPLAGIDCQPSEKLNCGARYCPIPTSRQVSRLRGMQFRAKAGYKD